jgi:hypothetical protein
VIWPNRGSVGGGLGEREVISNRDEFSQLIVPLEEVSPGRLVGKTVEVAADSAFR